MGLFSKAVQEEFLSLFLTAKRHVQEMLAYRTMSVDAVSAELRRDTVGVL